MRSLLCLLFLVACAEAPSPPPPAPNGAQSLAIPSTPQWPAYGSSLRRQAMVVPQDFGVRRVFLDPGHGAGKNEGNNGVRCQVEEVHTLHVAEMLHKRLTDHPNFISIVGRKPTTRPSYTSRVASAKKWRADVFLSIHSDARGDTTYHQWPDGRECLRNDIDTGFSVLWSNEGPLGPKRHLLAERLALRLATAGITPYDGNDYGDLYGKDATVAGVFKDQRGLLVLRRPAMPSVIIETHHALSMPEVERWDDIQTEVAFEDAVIAGLLEALRVDEPSE